MIKSPLFALRAALLPGLFWVSMAFADPTIEIPRQKPCDLFPVGTPVQFESVLHDFPTGKAEVTVTLSNYFNETKTQDLAVETKAGEPAKLPLSFGVLDPGYYEIKLTASYTGADGKPVVFRSKPTTLGVVRFMERTAEEARKEGSRFGLKMWYIQKNEETPWMPEEWDEREVVGAMCRLGLQWTRALFNEGPKHLSTESLIQDFPINVVLKVEGFPENCFDVARYGTIEEWKAKHKGLLWMRCTVPIKEPYQKWLREEIAKIPAEQNIYEMGNEVWNYMSAEEFAEWCRMSVPIIKEVRPNARVGADPGIGLNNYGLRFLAAGGMEGMDLVFNHPYSFTPLPEHRTRPALRNLRDVLEKRLGKKYDLYITEYGWSVAPKEKDGKSVSEKVQAQRTTRQSLMLYAEDAKALIPHWMGDREQDPTDREHWFGFFHINHQPRPVAIAHAVCARMIDSSKFVGDLWFGPGVGAMLFERNGKHTLALWTAEIPQKTEIDVGAPEVTVVDIMGREKKVRTNRGKLPLKLDGDVTYLVGVNPSLAARIVAADSDFDSDRWSTRTDALSLRKMSSAPEIDGSLKDWTALKAVELPKVGGESSGPKVETWLGWDANFVYAAVKVSGDETAKHPFELRLGTRPARQPDLGGMMVYDYGFALTPPAQGTEGSLVVNNDDFDKPLECKPTGDPSGIRWASQRTSDGWTGELAIPIKYLKGFPEPKAGSKISGRMTLKTDQGLHAYGNETARKWPYLTLEN